MIPLLCIVWVHSAHHWFIPVCFATLNSILFRNQRPTAGSPSSVLCVLAIGRCVTEEGALEMASTPRTEPGEPAVGLRFLKSRRFDLVKHTGINRKWAEWTQTKPSRGIITSGIHRSSGIRNSGESNTFWKCCVTFMVIYRRWVANSLTGVWWRIVCFSCMKDYYSTTTLEVDIFGRRGLFTYLRHFLYMPIWTVFLFV